ncbi:hypothetical protein, partial [Streptococcus suis]
MKIEISVDEALNKELIDLSRRYFKNMQPSDYGRIDFIIGTDRKPYFLEVNTMMNLGIHSGSVLSFLNSGFKTYENIILTLLN